MKLELETRRAAHERLKHDMRNESERSFAQIGYLSLASNNIIKVVISLFYYAFHNIFFQLTLMSY